MSREAAQAFIVKMLDDPEFKGRVLALEDPADRIELIRAEGFDCSAEDIAAVGGGPLTDTALEGVAGAAGYSEPCDPCPQNC